MCPSKSKFISLIFLLSGCCFFQSVYAEDSTAVYFANQAGVIAGAAESCGQPISTFVMRVGEVIDVLATDPTDKTYATAAFESSRRKGHEVQQASQQMTCPKVINDYNSLPLLQPDYRKSVIEPLMTDKSKPASRGNTTNESGALPPTSGATPLLPSQQHAQMGAPAAAAPTSEAAHVAATIAAPPPAQQYVTAKPTLNNGAVPPINPAANPANANVASGSSTNMAQNTELARLQLAQQLAQMAQSLVSNTAPPPTNAVGVNPATNPQLNTQLYGFGANNPMLNGSQDP